jgi:hypothetical protein
MRWQVRLQWVAADEGGRRKPFRGKRYSTPVRLPGDAGLIEMRMAWSMTIVFPDENEVNPSLGIVEFLSLNAPVHRVQPGDLIEFYEGRRLTARANVESVVDTVERSTNP